MNNVVHKCDAKSMLKKCYFVPAEDAELIKRLRAAGGIVMGKTNIHEMSYGWTSNNLAFGAVHNPYGYGHIPGGSSGGTSAAIASRMAPIGIAEDTQGSIRVPAALCGVYGFRPTLNRYPNGGVMPITPLFDQVGPHTRSMDDLALFDHVITGKRMIETPETLAGVRLGVSRDYFFTDLEDEVARITQDAMDGLAEAGVEFVDADVPGLLELIELITYPVQNYHVMPMFARYLEMHNVGITLEQVIEALSEDVGTTFASLNIPDEAFIAARDEHLPALRTTMQSYFERHSLDGMIFPCTRVTATPVGDTGNVDINGQAVPFDVAIARNISPGSTAGIPGLVIPAGLSSEGLPVSIEIDGPAGSDRRILEIGFAAEQVLGHLPAPVIRQP